METTVSSTKRRMKERPALVVRASYASQETAFQLFGITPRKFRETIVPRCDGVVRIGRTVTVPVDEVERVLRRMAAESGGNVAIWGDLPSGVHVDTCDTADDDIAAERDARDVPDTVDGVLAKLGLRRAA